MKLNLAKIDWTLSSPPSPYKNLSCIYFVHLMDPKDPSRYLPIQRLLGTDREGVVDIGYSADLASKMWHFKGAFFGTPRNDSGGWNLGYLYNKNEWLKKTFGTKEDLLDKVQFEYIKTPKDLRPVRARKFIDDHCGRFGEPPVLVGEFPKVLRKSTSPIVKAASGKGPQIDPEKLHKIRLIGSPLGPLTKKSCIYWAKLMDRTVRSKSVLMTRFNKTDPSGTFVIGRTKDLNHKIRQIRYDIRHTNRHGEWGLFNHVYDRCEALREVCGPRKDFMDRLELTYFETARSNLDRSEIWAINEYIEKFAELPPFNSQIPGDTRYK
jgi:hypothetical protein